MNKTALLAFLCLAACGGKTAVASGDASDHAGDASSTETGGRDHDAETAGSSGSGGTSGSAATSSAGSASGSGATSASHSRPGTGSGSGDGGSCLQPGSCLADSTCCSLLLNCCPSIPKDFRSACTGAAAGNQNACLSVMAQYPDFGFCCPP